MKRILVIGSCGAGKSTFSRRLGRALGLEVIHLDQHYWKPNWVESEKPEWRERVARLIERDSWIIDGNYSGTLELRMERCDTVVFLDIPRHVCLWRVLKRVLTYREGKRPDMAEGCPERFDLAFLWWVWTFPKRSRSKIISRLDANSRLKRVVRIQNNAEAEKFLGEVARESDESSEREVNRVCLKS